MADEYELVHHLDKVMRRIISELQHHIPDLDIDGIGPFGIMVIDGLSVVAPAPVQKLVQYMERDASQMTRTIRLLESKKLIGRKKSKEDGRVDILSLTEKGATLVEAVHGAMNDAVIKTFSFLDDEEYQRLLTTLRKLPGCHIPPKPGNQEP